MLYRYFRLGFTVSDVIFSPYIMFHWRRAGERDGLMQFHAVPPPTSLFLTPFFSCKEKSEKFCSTGGGSERSSRCAAYICAELLIETCWVKIRENLISETENAAVFLDLGARSHTLQL